ncbi:MAG: CHAD domain-containing protein [Chlorobium sp.]|uniref:CHAD domain-containing protein n=1 Tax=Chlorobium sp. TaxID=1095 RepID=UPI0025BB87E9|nr:CHAD domain-containing protein [Chlorobium sp.]MCF8382454.1 CHAD domain-containing protein [Chlorobium sp.]
MDALKTIYFKPGNGFDIESFLNSPTFPVRFRPEPGQKERRIFYDTFDWQFFNHGLAVAILGRKLSLIDLKSGIERSSIPFLSVPEHFLPSLLPPGPLREELEAITDLRALLRRCTIDVEIFRTRILDSEDKTTGFLLWESCTLVRKGERVPVTGMLVIKPLKGFQDEAESLARHFEELQGNRSVTEFRELFTLFMHAAGQKINDYSTKISLSLQPADPVRKSAAELLLAALGVMKRNEGWIGKNIDTEFLHDYRVAVRRTRSVISRIGGIFEAETTETYRRAFRETGNRCNAFRDSDVYLLRESEYRAMLPLSLAGHIDAFFRDLRATRTSEQRRFSAFLRSKAYSDAIAGWERLLEETIANPYGGSPPAAGLEPTLSVARKHIAKAWKKVIRHGRAIPAEASDTELHTLRIDCKRLRYLLELFSSLFPGKTIGPVVRHLKELQDNLGMFVDLAVQQRYLLDRLDGMRAKPSNPELAAALGGLVTLLHLRQEKARKAFHRTFRLFDNDETEALFRELLNS